MKEKKNDNISDELPHGHSWKVFKNLPKELKTTEELTGHDVSGT